LTSIIEQRQSLHRQLQIQEQINAELKNRLEKLQALANIGTCTCMIAHEINNLLGPLGNYAQLALKYPDDSKLAGKALEKTAANSARASRIMESIIALANAEDQDYRPTKLRKLTEQIFTSLCRDFSKDNITVQIDIPDDFELDIVPVQIQQVMMNLILNARKAMLPSAGRLEITARKEGDIVSISVADTGCGIKEENLQTIFEPFFSTGPDSEQNVPDTGTGLGLAFCKKVVEAHSGSICVESTENKGTIFTVKLPQHRL